MSENIGKEIAVVAVPRYLDEEKVYGLCGRVWKLLGGSGAFVKPEERILVKPNFAGADRTSHHPPGAVMREMFRLLSGGVAMPMCFTGILRTRLL